MGLLHELLAVEADLRSDKDKERDSTIRSFTSNPAAFLGAIKNLFMFDENRSGEEQEIRQEIACTVEECIKTVDQKFGRYWDLRLQKETANQEAKADVIVNGKIIFSDLPVTFILNMEEELRQLKKVYQCLPTLKPGVEWITDAQKGRGIYKAEHPTETAKTEKKLEYKVIVQATDKFPAQYESTTVDRPIGKYVTENWSGMISDADKAVLLLRVDTLLQAFKKARQRANCNKTEPMEVARALFDFIHHGSL